MASDQQSAHLYSPKGLTRWYIDVRGLTASTTELPLLSRLDPSDQTTIQKFYHLSDRHMSLASYLLKYLFIHQTCRVPWNEVVISRTPAPHQRPCYIPVRRGDNESVDGNALGVQNIEFNVSHQAGMVALAGCIVPSDVSASNTESSPSAPTGPVSTPPQTGVDITCVNERGRRNKDSIPKTEADLHSFIDIFAEVFSARELRDMKTSRPPSSSTTTAAATSASISLSLEQSIAHRLRVFYTHWALKEAYIKMTGEALLAPWLRELEFRDVVPPEPTTPDSTGRAMLSQPSSSMKILLHGREVQDVRIEVAGLGEEYLFATAAKGKGVGAVGPPTEARGEAHPDAELANYTNDGWSSFRLIDIDTNIEPCATGVCKCLLP